MFGQMTLSVPAYVPTVASDVKYWLHQQVRLYLQIVQPSLNNVTGLGFGHAATMLDRLASSVSLDTLTPWYEGVPQFRPNEGTFHLHLDLCAPRGSRKLQEQVRSLGVACEPAGDGRSNAVLRRIEHHANRSRCDLKQTQSVWRITVDATSAERIETLAIQLRDLTGRNL